MGVGAGVGEGGVGGVVVQPEVAAFVGTGDSGDPLCKGSVLSATTSPDRNSRSWRFIQGPHPPKIYLRSHG